MSIEFRCVRCGKLLRTGDDTSGRQAQCPECGAISMVPPPAPAPGAAPTGEAAGPSVAGPAYAAGPGAYHSPDAAYAAFPAQRVSGPATGLMVTAVLGMALQALVLIGDMIHIVLGIAVWPQAPHGFPVMPQSATDAAARIFFLAMSILVLIGARKMKNLENYSFAITAAIVALIPCCSPCCLLGLPFGIWALVILGDSSVRAAFRS